MILFTRNQLTAVHKLFCLPCLSATRITVQWILLAAFVAGAQGLVNVDLRLEGFHPLEESVEYVNPLKGLHPAVLKLNTTMFTEQEDIDFEQRQVTFSRVDKLGFSVWTYHYPELSEYLLGRQRFSLHRAWYARNSQIQQDQKGNKGLPNLEFVMPVQYPDWAQRILGKDPPKLTINGQLKLTVGYEQERFTKSRRIGTKGAIFEQENRFSVRGTVGRVIDINVSTNSEESFDVGNQLKNFKVEYKGEGNELEDEVVQEVTAGFTGFSMPGSDLSGYSEAHEGLFGIKVKSQLGPLELTTIISHEQGEPEELNFRQSAGSSRSAATESDLVKYRYFWVDSLYKKQYLARVSGTDTMTNMPTITAIQVYVQSDKMALSTKGTNEIFRNAHASDSTNVMYKRLKRDVHFEVSEKDGWIRIDSGAVIEDRTTRIGLYVVFDNTARIENKGDTTFTGELIEGRDVMTDLWLLKPADPKPEDPTFGLEWRNVYRGPRSDINEQFVVSVKRIAEGTTDSTHELSSKRLFSEILGLTDENGQVLDRRVPGFIKPIRVFDTQRGLLVLPPFADKAIGMNPFANPLLDKVNTGDSRIINTRIYQLSYSQFIESNFRDQYKLELSGVSEDRQSTFDLGWGVMKNTEKVKAGNVTLERYKDYTIDYDMGTVTLVSKRALAGNDVKIEYQREALFVPEKKLFMGARGEIRLPFISDNAFAAASVLFQRATSRDEIPRIGQEPYRKLLLDINTKLDWEPAWMTNLVDAIPGIKTQVSSKVDFDLEVAHSQMNPNISGSGEAYVDDFEASRQVTPLGDSYKNWFRASPPYNILNNMITNPPAWWDYWFNPHINDEEHRVEKNSIWDLNEDPTSSQDKFENVLKLIAYPRPPATNDITDRYDHPWTGIMTYLSAGLSDRSKDKYLEFWVRANVAPKDSITADGRRVTVLRPEAGNSSGVLFIDLGVLSEDISINGGPPDGSSEPASEDTSGIGLFNIETDDLGLDFTEDKNEFWVCPNAARDGWDTLLLNDPRLPVPSDPDRDNYAYYGRDSLSNRSKVNGTQNDAESNPNPSTEDINGDGYMDLRHQERFFRYRVDLDSLMKYESSRFLDTTANRNPAGHFYRVRIPINDPTLADTILSYDGTPPSFSEIRGVRLYWTDFDSADSYKEKRLELTRMQFVGNQWLPRAVRAADVSDTSDAEFEVSVVNNEDDAEYRSQFLRGTRGGFPFNTDTYDLPNNAIKREQALKISFSDVETGDTVLVDRWFSYHPYDFSMYNQLRMYVYSSKNFENDSVYAVLRFGTDSLTYYQVRSNPLVEGWNGNEIVCDLKELTKLKLDYLTAHPGATDTIDAYSDDGRYIVKAAGRSVPNISRVSWIAVGIVHGGQGLATVNGEVWLNGLRVAGTRILAGNAARFRLSTQWADFMDLSTEVNYQDGDFRRMTETEIRAGDSRLDGNLSANLKMDKFFPSELGLAIPLGASVTTAVTRPQLAPQTDVSLVNEETGKSDRLSDMAKDAFETLLPSVAFQNNPATNSEPFQTTRATQTVNSSFDKNSRSDKPWVNLTIDRITLDGRFNHDRELRYQGYKPSGHDMYIDSTDTRSGGGYLKYDLSPQSPPKWTKWKPFGKAKATWVSSRTKAIEFSLLPRTLRFDLADNVNYTERRSSVARSGIYDSTKTLTMGHGFQFDYTPISPLLDISYGFNLSRDFNKDIQNGVGNIGTFFTEKIAGRDENWKRYGVLYGENRRNQNASLGFRPQFFDWLTHRVNYSAVYNEGFSKDPQEKTVELLDASVDGTFKFDSDLQFGELFRNLAKRMERIAFANTIFEGMKTGTDKIGLRSIRFEYSAVSNIKNYYLSPSLMQGDFGITSLDFFLYQLGARRDKESGLQSLYDIMAGDYSDRTTFGGMYYRASQHEDPNQYSRDTRRGSRKYKLSTNFKVPGLDLTVNPISFGWEYNYTVTPDTSRSERSWVRPDMRLGASTPILNKLGVISKNFQTVGLSTAYNYKYREDMTKASGDLTKHQIWNHDLNPLVKVSGTLRARPIRFSYSHSIEVNKDQGQTIDFKTTRRDNATLNYDIPHARTKREIKLLKWSIPIEGRTNIGVTFDHTSSKRYNSGSDTASVLFRQFAPNRSDTPTSESEEYALRPELTYTFTSKISGKAAGEYTQTTSTTEPPRRYVKIAGTVDIRF